MVISRRGGRTLLAVALGVGVAIGPATAATAAPAAPAAPKPRLVLAASPLVALRSGGHSAVHEELWNLGNAPESAPVVLSVSLAPGVFVTNLPTECAPQPLGHTAICHFPAGLKPGHADRVTIPIVAANHLPPAILTGLAQGGTATKPAWGSPARFLLVVLPWLCPLSLREPQGSGRPSRAPEPACVRGSAAGAVLAHGVYPCRKNRPRHSAGGRRDGESHRQADPEKCADDGHADALGHWIPHPDRPPLTGRTSRAAAGGRRAVPRSGSPRGRGKEQTVAARRPGQQQAPLSPMLGCATAGTTGRGAPLAEAATASPTVRPIPRRLPMTATPMRLPM